MRFVRDSDKGAANTMRDPMTSPIRCLLVDDEPPALDELSYLLSGFEDVRIVGTAMSASQAMEEIVRLRPEVVFQDIQMPGATGFHVLERALKCPEPPLFVFATAYDQYAIRAFEENAVDYLLKPVSRERLANCLGRLRNQLRHMNPGQAQTRALDERRLRDKGRVVVQKPDMGSALVRQKLHDPIQRPGPVQIFLGP